MKTSWFTTFSCCKRKQIRRTTDEGFPVVADEVPVRKHRSILRFPKQNASHGSLKTQLSVTFLHEDPVPSPTTCSFDLASNTGSDLIGSAYELNKPTSRNGSSRCLQEWGFNHLVETPDEYNATVNLACRSDSGIWGQFMNDNTHRLPPNVAYDGSSQSSHFCQQNVAVSGPEPLVSRLPRSITSSRRVVSLVEISPKFSTSRETQRSSGSSQKSSTSLFSRNRRQIHPSSSDSKSRSYSGSNFIFVSPPGLNDLPVELLMIICQYIPKDTTYVALGCVNRRFHELLQTDTFTRAVRLRISDGLKPKLLLEVLSVSRSLRALDVSGCLSVTDNFLIYVARNCPGITDINVSGCVMVTDLGLEKIARCLTRVERLAVANVRQITCEGLIRVMVQHSASFKELDISCCYGLEQSAFRLSVLGEFCPELERLDFRWSAEHITWISIWETRVTQLCQLCPHLRHVDLSCNPARDVKVILQTISTSCRDMRCLKVSRCCVRDDCLLSISGLPHLEELDLSGSPELSGVSLAFAFRQLPCLRILNLSGCYRLDDESIVPVLSSIPNIRDLHLRNCYELSDNGVIHVSRACLHLGYLDVSGTKISRAGVRNVQDTAPEHLILITEDCPLMGLMYENIWHRIPLVALPFSNTWANQLRTNAKFY